MLGLVVRQTLHYVKTHQVVVFLAVAVLVLVMNWQIFSLSRRLSLAESKVLALERGGGVSMRPPTFPPQQLTNTLPPPPTTTPAPSFPLPSNPPPASGSVINYFWNVDADTVLLVLTCNRADYLRRTLDSILKVATADIPVIVSQDGTNDQVASLLTDFANAQKLTFLQHNNPSDPPEQPDRTGPAFRTYYLISRHYQWALSQIFASTKANQIIILEDDMEVSVDFFAYFKAMVPIVQADPTLWCVSAWNDNGRPGLVTDPNSFYRSDFFPGLGWLLTRRIWGELQPKWPKGFWDDWMREPQQRQGRACIRPEMARVNNFGESGASGGQFYNQYIRPITVNQEPANFLGLDLKYLLKENYDGLLMSLIARAAPQPPRPEAFDAQVVASGADIAITYDAHEFGSIANAFGLMPDDKAGVPRTAYLGVVSFRFQGRNRVWLAPKDNRVFYQNG